MFRERDPDPLSLLPCSRFSGSNQLIQDSLSIGWSQAHCSRGQLVSSLSQQKLFVQLSKTDLPLSFVLTHSRPEVMISVLQQYEEKYNVSLTSFLLWNSTFLGHLFETK